MKRSVLIAALVLLVFASGDDRAGVGRSQTPRQPPPAPDRDAAEAVTLFPPAASADAWHPVRAVSIARSAGHFEAPSPLPLSDALTLGDRSAARGLPHLLSALRDYPVVALLVVDRAPPPPDAIGRLPFLAADRRDSPASPNLSP